MIHLISMTAAAPSAGSQLYPLIIMIIMLVVLYLIMIRPQRKKEKADAEMRKNVQIGDEIETIGGIVGIITKIEENSVVIETSSDRCKMRIKKWAISTNVSANEEQKAKEDAARTAKAEKKSKSEEKSQDKPAKAEKPIDKD